MDLAYDSAEEDAFRKAIFAQTDAMIQEHNSEPESTYQMAHNQLSAMVNNLNIHKQKTAIVFFYNAHLYIFLWNNIANEQ